MIKIAQFGEGNFLRAFVDLYFDILNQEGGEYAVDIIKPTTHGNIDKFKRQNNKYHVVLRGSEGGKSLEKVYKVNILNDVFLPNEENKFYELAREKDLKIVVSNTTEAGICFCDGDSFDDIEKMTFPAKLTKFLFERYNSGAEGVYLLPAELIDNNAGELYSCVNKYIALWNLPKGFKKWNDEKNFYCNTLVDRIVSGFPKDDITKTHLYDIIGEQDELLSICEPFGFWAIEKKGEIDKFIKSGVHNIEVVLDSDIKYYKKRKVRVLNGSHTNIVPVGLWCGKQTVYDCMKDKTLSKFLEDTLNNEIVPFVSSDIVATKQFAESIKDRFLNPFLNHQLISIALNSISKWKARNLPSFRDYYEKNKVIPKNLTIGFSYLMALYCRCEKKGEKYYAKLPSQEIQLSDETEYLEFFANGGKVADFMQDKRVWGEDLSLYSGFIETVCKNVDRIEKGESLL